MIQFKANLLFTTSQRHLVSLNIFIQIFHRWWNINNYYIVASVCTYWLIWWSILCNGAVQSLNFYVPHHANLDLLLYCWTIVSLGWRSYSWQSGLGSSMFSVRARSWAGLSSSSTSSELISSWPYSEIYSCSF